MPTVRVVIVEYDGAEVLPKCLASLASTVPPETRITVIDNASGVEAETLIPSELVGKIEILRLDANVGYAGAIHRAWSIGDEPFLVVANNDIEFTSGWLDALVSTAEESGAYAISAVIEHENESDLEKNTNASLNPLLYLIPGIFKDRTKAVYPSGACFLLRRDGSLPIVPIDPDYFMYYEDVYIGFLLRALGKAVDQCPRSRVKHIGSHAVKRADTSRMAFHRERNRLVTQILFFDFQTLLGLAPLILADSILKIPQCLVIRKPVGPTIRAHFRLPFNIGSILKKRAALRRLPDFKPRRILPWLTGKVSPPDVPGAGFWNFLSAGWCRIVGIPVGREARDAQP